MPDQQHSPLQVNLWADEKSNGAICLMITGHAPCNWQRRLKPEEGLHSVA